MSNTVTICMEMCRYLVLPIWRRTIHFTTDHSTFPNCSTGTSAIRRSFIELTLRDWSVDTTKIIELAPIGTSTSAVGPCPDSSTLILQWQSFMQGALRALTWTSHLAGMLQSM